MQSFWPDMWRIQETCKEGRVQIYSTDFMQIKFILLSPAGYISKVYRSVKHIFPLFSSMHILQNVLFKKQNTGFLMAYLS
jgi:uncharacterized membrane protein